MACQIRMAVLDDDMTEIHKTEQMISAYEKMNPEHEYIVACYTEVKTFMEAICIGEDTAEWVYDILLMDVYLPDGNGIKCGRRLRDKGFAGVIIYKSSTAENCLDALSVEALQYLIKPVSEDKLFETMGERWWNQNRHNRHLILGRINILKLRFIRQAERAMSFGDGMTG